MQLAEGDSTVAEARQTCADKLKTRLQVTSFTFESESTGSVETVTLELPQFELPEPIALILPPLSVVSYATSEI